MQEILSYKDYEKAVYDWLLSKNTQDSTFTFSLRQVAAKGSQTDYFIGTEKSGYFGTTFWYLPVSFPGSSGDCIALLFTIGKNGYNYSFEFTQTTTPHNAQNTYALNLVRSLQEPLNKRPGLNRQTNDNQKMFTLRTKPKKRNYREVGEMLSDIDDELDYIISLVNTYIEREKTAHPDFKAHRITQDEFEGFTQKMQNRIARHNSPEMESSTGIPDLVNESPPIETPDYDAPLNQIFYGPPGTGKTYNTVLEAAKIVSGNSNLTYKEALKIFNDNRGSAIEFVTFHQNFSYEDFIQGLRPDVTQNNHLSFERKDGIFKKIADRAYVNYLASEKKQSQKKPFDEIFREFIRPLIEEEEEITVKMKKAAYYITDISERTIFFRKDSGGTAHTLSLATLEKMYDMETIGGIQGLSVYYEPLLNLLLQKGKSATFQKVQKKNYVIVIDEINRANISRVFGELITLIEKDKRSHGEIPMQVTLPSGDTFIVPSNLYIIGTMNTADKSISLLDIALRRRFEFKPMYPQYEIDGSLINHHEILKTLNDRICKEKTRDFQIGHAYFMENANLDDIMNKKVIPLLLEYFMNDEKKVLDIISIEGCSVDSTCWPMKFSKN